MLAASERATWDAPTILIFPYCDDDDDNDGNDDNDDNDGDDLEPIDWLSLLERPLATKNYSQGLVMIAWHTDNNDNIIDIGNSINDNDKPGQSV